MQITINGKDYDLYFGFDFIDYVNNSKGLMAQGIALGVAGMKILTTGLDSKAPSALVTVLKGAINTLKSKPSNEDVEKFIEEMLVNGTYDDFFDDVLVEMGKHLLILKEIGISKKDWDNIINQNKMKKKKQD